MPVVSFWIVPADPAVPFPNTANSPLVLTRLMPVAALLLETLWKLMFKVVFEIWIAVPLTALMTPPWFTLTVPLTAPLIVRLPALLAARAVPFWLVMLSVLNVVVPVSVCRFTAGAPVAARDVRPPVKLALPAELMMFRAEAPEIVFVGNVQRAVHVDRPRRVVDVQPHSLPVIDRQIVERHGRRTGGQVRDRNGVSA